MDEAKLGCLRQALHNGLAIATGCTEPVALAYAGSIARHLTQGEVEEILIEASSNVIKNAFVVGIPKTDARGIQQAVAFGVAINNPENGLNIFAEATPSMAEEGKRLVQAGKVILRKAQSDLKLHIIVTVKTKADIGQVEIKNTHTHIAKITQNGKCLFHDEEGINATDGHECAEFTLKDIVDFCLHGELGEFDVIREAIQYNQEVALEGMRNPYGLQVGRTIQKNIEKKLLGDDIANYAMMMAAAGSDARMAGSAKTVMTNSGSGNQGITATVPVIAVWEKLHIQEAEKLIRAVALSNLVTIYIKSKFGILSALCGAVVASTGASCAMVYLLGGDEAKMEIAIHNVLGNVTGMVCDGAKSSCALKISSCTNAAYQAALLAMDDLRIQSDEGIVECLSEYTIDNFATLGNQCSDSIDRVVLDMMMHKK